MWNEEDFDNSDSLNDNSFEEIYDANSNEQY